MTLFPVDPRARMTLGLRSLTEAAWLQPDHLRAHELALKDELLGSQLSEVYAQLPAGLDGARELAELLVANVCTNWPEMFTEDSPGAVTDHELHRIIDIDSEHPLLAVGRLVQEDLLVMSQLESSAGSEWVLTAAILTAPSRWRLLDKMGKELTAIHSPVPGYAEQIGSPVNAMFDKLLVERPMWRANWSLLDDPTLYQPTTRGPQQVEAAADLGKAMHFRVERQTLRKMPMTGDIAFTIRTYVQTLEEVLATEPDAATTLREFFSHTPEDMVEYKGWQFLMQRLDKYLASR